MNNKIKIRVLIASVIILILILTGHKIAFRNSEKSLETKGKTDIEAMAEPKEHITSVFENEGQEKTIEPKTESQTQPEPQSESQSEIMAPVEVKLVMIGDMLLHDVVQYTGEMPDGTYNYDHFFTHIKQDIQNADVAVVNQEVIIGGAEFGISGYPDFNCREEVGDALVKAGFDIVLHATNHSMDRGQKGIENCMNFWDSRYPQIKYLGLNRTQQDYENSYAELYLWFKWNCASIRPTVSCKPSG